MLMIKSLYNIKYGELKSQPMLRKRSILKNIIKATSLNPVGDRFEVISSAVIESKQADTPLDESKSLVRLYYR